MPAAVILGGHWGDEGKGKVIDLLASRFDYNVRYGGGANAGHTVVNDRGSFALHQVPSGVFHPGMTAMLASAVVVDPEALLGEMSGLEGRGVELDRFYISERAHIVMPFHRALDVAAERKLGDAKLGTTGKGIGPAYADKASRTGLRIGDMLDATVFTETVRRTTEAANEKLTRLYDMEPLDPEPILSAAAEWARLLGPRICDVEQELREALARGSSVLLEGAQGALLDIDMGSYPFVTSSSTGVGGACASTGIPPSAISSVVSVMHTYMTRVGTGPFPTELHDGTGDHIRQAGNEFGTTTGRPRRCGWFDAVASKYAVDVNGATTMALTKLDVLDGLDPVRICVGYRVDDREISRMPSRASVLARAEPIYEELPGWDRSTSDARSWDDLPAAAQHYVRRIEDLMGVPVSILSVGPSREQTVVLRDPLA